MFHINLSKATDLVENILSDECYDCNFYIKCGKSQSMIMIRNYEMKKINRKACIVLSITNTGLLIIKVLLGTAEINANNLANLNKFNIKSPLFTATIGPNKHLKLSSFNMFNSLKMLGKQLEFYLYSISSFNDKKLIKILC